MSSLLDKIVDLSARVTHLEQWQRRVEDSIPAVQDFEQWKEEMQRNAATGTVGEKSQNGSSQ